MNRNSAGRVPCLVAGVLLLLPIGAVAQGVILTHLTVEFVDGGLLAGNFLALGKGGRTSILLLGGSQDGEMILKDTDAFTTTINLLGEFGFIQLGSVEDDGDLRLWDNNPDNEFSIDLDGGTGNVTNQLGGNGLVKAWAKINANGTIAACWRCNIDINETRKTGTGFYEVDFTPLGSDIRARVELCSPLPVAVPVFSLCGTLDSDPSSVFVQINNTADALTDAPFKVVIF